MTSAPPGFGSPFDFAGAGADSEFPLPACFIRPWLAPIWGEPNVPVIHVRGVFSSAPDVSPPTVAVVMPQGIVDGDVGWIIFTINSATNPPNPAPSGWTLVQSDSPSAALTAYLYKRSMLATDSGTTVTMTWNAGGKTSAAGMVCDAAFQHEGLAFTTDSAASSTMDLPAYTTIADHVFLLNLNAHQYPGATGFSAWPAGWTRDISGESPVTPPSTGSTVAHMQLSYGAGSTVPARSATYNVNSRDVCYVIGLSPNTNPFTATEAALATAAAGDAQVSVAPSGVEAALATAAANDAQVSVAVSAEAALADASVSEDTTSLVSPTAEAALSASSAGDPSTAVTPSGVEAALATAAGNDAAPSVAVNAEAALATAASQDAPLTYVIAEAALATASGNDPSTAVTPSGVEAALATAAANDAQVSVSVSAEAALSTSAAGDAAPSIAVSAEAALATGAGGDATTLISPVSEAALATAAGQDPGTAVAPSGVEAALATGTANNTTTAVAPGAEAALATAAANDAPLTTALAEAALATAAGNDAAPSVAVNAEAALATAAANDATTLISTVAQNAVSTAAAGDAGPSVGANAEAALAGAAANDVPMVAPSAEAALATAAALDASVSVSVSAGAATATAVANDAVEGVTIVGTFSGANAATQTTMTLTLPTGIVDGDVGYVLFVANASAATIVTPPAGWTQLDDSSAGTTLHGILFTKSMLATESGTTVAAVWDASTRRLAGVGVVARAQPARDGIVTVTDSSLDSQLTIPAYTPAVDNVLLINLNGSQHPTSTGFTAWAPGWTKDEDAQGTTALPQTAASSGHRYLTGGAGTPVVTQDATFNSQSRELVHVIGLVGLLSTNAPAEAALATAAANNPGTAVAPGGVEAALATAAANDATVAVAVAPVAEAALATAAANDAGPSVAPTAEAALATATGADSSTSIAPTSQAATATAAGNDAAGSVAPTAEAALSTGTANDATVTTTTNDVSVAAGNAAATAAANDAQVSVAVSAGTAVATAAANNVLEGVPIRGTFSNAVAAVGTTISMTLPTGIVDGDVGWVQFATNNSTDTITTPPSGWTAVSNVAVGSTLQSWLYTKSMLATESGTSVTAVWSANGKLAGSGIVAGGKFAPDATPVGTGDNSADTSLTIPAVTPVNDDVLLVVLTASQHPTSTGFSAPPTNYTTDQDAQGVTALPQAGAQVFHRYIIDGAGVPVAADAATYNSASRDQVWQIGIAQQTSPANAPAEAALANASANDATVTTQNNTFAAAEAALATATASDAAGAIAVSAEVALGTAAAQDSQSSIAAGSEAATSSAAAGDPASSVAPSAEAALATAAGQDAPLAAPSAEAALSSAAALDATVALAVSAQAATGTAIANDAASSVAATAEAALATGVANAPTPSRSESGQARLAPSTAAAFDAAAQVTAAGTPTAATLTAAALDATVAVRVSAEVAGAAAGAVDPHVDADVTAFPTTATATGVASDATPTRTSTPTAGCATATATAGDPRPMYVRRRPAVVTHGSTDPVTARAGTRPGIVTRPRAHDTTTRSGATARVTVHAGSQR